MKAGKGSTLELSEAISFHVSDEDHYKAIVNSVRLRPYLLGSPGPHWLAVSQSSRKKFIAVLEELGFKINVGADQGAFKLSDLKAEAMG